MKHRARIFLIAVILCLAPAASWADLTPYSQDFEGLVQADPAALGNDGWLVFANVFAPGGGYLYGYGVYPAPNGGPGFSAIDSGVGGAAQGAQQLVVYSDYNNGDHGNGNIIEANVFQERIVGAVDVGSTWIFEWDATRGNIEGASTAMAFFKTLDPNNGYALTNFIFGDMTPISTEWSSHSLSIYIDASLENQILQFGFLNTATSYTGSGVFYDNVNFAPQPVGACCTPFECTEVPVGECVGQYGGDFTTCGETDCSGPLFITMCHIPPGNVGNPQTITVGLAAVDGHLAHGDELGSCDIGINPGDTYELTGDAINDGAQLQQTSGVTPQEELPVDPPLRLQGKSKTIGKRDRSK